MIPVTHDPSGQQPIPSAWRPTLRAIVAAFVRGDDLLADAPPDVERLGPERARQIRDVIADYGETLVDLPDETWNSSVCQWMDTHWDAIVDLWTESEGLSDLVLHAEVFEQESGFRFRVRHVYVP